MVGRGFLRPAAWIAAAALAAPLMAQGQAPAGLVSGPTAGAKFPAGGVTVSVPGHPECVLTVESWENGSFLVPNGQPRPAWSAQMRGRWLKPGTHDTSDQAGQDEREIVNHLNLSLKYSPDMVDKVTKGCTAKGSIAIRLVRDDPFVNVAHTIVNSNLVIIDMSDVAKTVSQVATNHPAGTPDLTRYEAPGEAARAFTFGLLAHEIDHLQENGDGAHADPGKGAPVGDAQGGAVRDENLVMKELGSPFRRDTYVNFQNGRPVVMYEAMDTQAVFDPARAILSPTTRVNGLTNEQDFLPEDTATVDGIVDLCRGCSGLTDTAAAPATQVGVPCKGSVTLEVSAVDATHLNGAVVNFSNNGTCELTPESLTAWISVGKFSSGVGNAGWVDLGFQRNTTGSPRVGTVWIGDEVLTVTQGAAEPTFMEMGLRFAPTGVDGIPTAFSAPDFRETVEAWRAVGMIPSLTAARPAPGPQKMGGTMLDYSDNRVVIASREAMPAWPMPGRLADAFPLLARGMSMTARTATGNLLVRADSRHLVSQAGRPGALSGVIAVFTSLGRSSGAAFRMDVVHDGPGPVQAFGDGFVLEPLARITPQQLQRELARVKGRRGTATIEAYCLEFAKTPPVLNTIYRLVPPAAAKAHANLPAIMAASKRLLSSGRLNPDSDPEEYFHAVRQWALWSDERGWRTEKEFGEAFVSHSQENLAAAGRPWTAQIDAAIRKLVPGRWRDIEAVRAEARAIAARSPR